MNAGGPRGAALIGWQTLLADLSLILFMVTAAALAARPGQVATKAKPVAPPGRAQPALGEPLAVWRAGGSQPLRHWLAREQPDSRQQLTITAHYRKGAVAPALRAVQALVADAGPMARAVRVIVAPASNAQDEGAQVSLAYDRPTPNAGLAQALLQPAVNPAARIQP